MCAHICNCVLFLYVYSLSIFCFKFHHCLCNWVVCSQFELQNFKAQVFNIMWIFTSEAPPYYFNQRSEKNTKRFITSVLWHFRWRILWAKASDDIWKFIDFTQLTKWGSLSTCPYTVLYGHSRELNMEKTKNQLLSRWINIIRLWSAVGCVVLSEASYIYLKVPTLIYTSHIL